MTNKELDRRQFFLGMSFISLFVNLTGLAIGYFDEQMTNALVALALYDGWIIGVFVILHLADKFYPKDNDGYGDNVDGV